MIAALAAAFLAQGETQVTAMAGEPYSSVHAEHAFGIVALSAGVDVARFIRPSVGARVLLFSAGPLDFSTRFLAARTLPQNTPEIAATWDGELAIRAELEVGNFDFLAEGGALGQSDFKVEHSAVFAQYVGGVDVRTLGPLRLVARGGYLQGSSSGKLIWWAGAAVRW